MAGRQVGRISLPHPLIIIKQRRAQPPCCLQHSALKYWPKLSDKAFRAGTLILSFNLLSLNMPSFRSSVSRGGWQWGMPCATRWEYYLITKIGTEKYKIKGRLPNSFRAGLYRYVKHTDISHLILYNLMFKTTLNRTSSVSAVTFVSFKRWARRWELRGNYKKHGIIHKADLIWP